MVIVVIIIHKNKCKNKSAKFDIKEVLYRTCSNLLRCMVSMAGGLNISVCFEPRVILGSPSLPTTDNLWPLNALMIKYNRRRPQHRVASFA